MDPLPEGARATARDRIQELVEEAEALVAAAKNEADRIVASAREDTSSRAGQLLADAEALRHVAEIQAAEVREEAEATRRAAREEADQLLADARRIHDEIISGAEVALMPSAEPGQPLSPTSLDDSDEMIAGARVEADRILRVTTAEANARSIEIIEKARRTAEANEAAARSRVEVLRQSYRTMQNTMRQEEIALRERLADLARSGGLPTPAPGSAPQDPVPPTVAPAEPTRERPSPTAPQPSPESPGVPESAPARAGEFPWSIRESIEQEADDPEVLKGIKAFRRRG